MLKKGFVLLLLVGLLVLVGCEEGIEQSVIDKILNDYTEWGENTETKPRVSFLVDDSGFYAMDISWEDEDENYTLILIDDITYSGNVISGITDANDAVSITCTYNNPNLKLVITGAGPLAGKTFTIQPASD